MSQLVEIRTAKKQIQLAAFSFDTTELGRGLALAGSGAVTAWLRYLVILGSFSKDNSDGNENVKKAIGLLSKTTSLHVRHAFLYISLLLLHDYDVKMPSFTFYGGRKQATTNFFLSF